MKQKKPLMAAAVVMLFAALIIFGANFAERESVRENKLVRADNQVKTMLAAETDFNRIAGYMEEDVERRRFLGIALIELAKNEERYVIDFEERYPRYKAYRDMVKELSRSDYSEWVAGVIAGEVETEFEANVFEYLGGLKDDRYVHPATSRFITILKVAGSSGFVFKSNKDAFILGAAGLYISQFPADSSALARTAMGQRINDFINLRQKITEEVNGIPLNKLYLYIYIKYFGLQDFIQKKMDAFMAMANPQTQTQTHWDGKSWDMRHAEGLIADLSAMGEGISQNYYTMFRMGFDKDEPIYIYIVLQVLEKIGFDDSALHEWLNRNYMTMEDRLTITTTTYSSPNRLPGRLSIREPVSTTTPVIIGDEIQQVRAAIKGKADVPFEEVLEKAIKSSAKNGNFIVPRVTADEEIRKEMRADSSQYTQDYVSRAVATWGAKHQLVQVIAWICLLAALACSLAVCFGSGWDRENPLLAWMILPLAGAVLFFGFWNRYSDLSGFQTMPFIAFLFFGGLPFIIILKTGILRTPGKALWQLLLRRCGGVNYTLKRFEVSAFYYDLGGLPLEKRINSLVKHNDVRGAVELLENTGDRDLAVRIVSSNPSFFRPVDPAVMEKILKNPIAWIDWLKKEDRQDILEDIRASTNEIVKNTIPDALIQDDRQYSDFIAGFMAFDYTSAENHNTIENIVSNTLIRRWNGACHTLPDVVLKVIDQVGLLINPSILLAAVQEENRSIFNWLWTRMEGDAAVSENPDGWFNLLVQAMVPEKLQKNMNIHSLLSIINMGFTRCTDCIPVFLLLIQARVYLEGHRLYDSSQKYNGIVEHFKTKIDKIQRKLDKSRSKA